MVSMTFISLWSWISCVSPKTKMLSMYATIPSCPCINSDIYHWKTSGANVMPKGSLLKQYLPSSVIKLVRWALFCSRGICQKPLLASKLENTVLLASLGSTSSKVGKVNLSDLTFLLSLFKSIQILIFPFFFIIGTIGADKPVRTLSLLCPSTPFSLAPL